MHWSEKALYLCFGLVLLLIPFDAYFLPVKVGPLTLYPYFLGVVLGVVLSFFVPGKKKSLPLNFKLLGGLASIWVFITFLLLFKVHDKHRALYAVRSILFLWLHIVFVFRVWQVMPTNTFKLEGIGGHHLPNTKHKNNMQPEE